MSRILVLSLTLFLMFANTYVAEAKHFEYVNSTLWGQINDIDVAGNYAYAAFANGLGIFDISDKTAPKLISELYIPGRVSGIKIYKSLAIISIWNSSVVSIDVSNVYKPKRVTSFSIPGNTGDITITGNYAYISAGGLKIIDLSNRDTLQLIGNYDISIAPLPNSHLGGIYFYLPYGNAWLGNKGLRIIDISDPFKPIAISDIHTISQVSHFIVKDNRIYAAEWGTRELLGLEVIDIIDPLNPVSLGSCPTRGDPTTIEISGNYAYLPEVSTGGPASLAVINISDPADMKLSRAIDTVSEALGSKIVGHYLYLTGSKNWQWGFNIFDISQPASPKRVGIYETTSITGLFADNGNCYVGYNGVTIVDPSNLGRLKIEGNLESSAGAEHIYKYGDYIFSLGWDGLDIFKESNLTLIKHYNNESSSPKFLVLGDKGYFVDCIDSLDLSALYPDSILTQIKLYNTSSYNPAGFAMGVAVSGKYAFAADYEFGLKVLSLTDSGTADLIAQVQTVYSRDDLGPVAIGVSGNYAFMPIWNGPLIIFDISSPTEPAIAGSFGGYFRVNDICVSNDVAYIATEGALRAVDISDPKHPSKIDDFDAASYCNSVYVVDKNIYLASESALFLLKLVD
jgi:hypothetical protein